MNVLIVINDLESGGAQKSLVSFLKMLEKDNHINEYNIDLLVATNKGVFMSEIPKGVNILRAEKKFKWLNCKVSQINYIDDFSINGIVGKLEYILRKKMNNQKYIFWDVWKKYIPKNKKKYDIAISYMDGWPNYYVIDKVNATKKVLWVHNEYQKLNYDYKYDEKYYSQADTIITISDKCKQSFTEVFSTLYNKIHVLENIVIMSELLEKSSEYEPEEFKTKKIKILSVGRLSYQKNFELAINAANLLQERKVDFCWVILGEGENREILENMISDNHLSDKVFLPGIKKNPYPYLKNADIFVQSSRFEGKSIVLDEAKLFKLPIVVTKYETVYDNITDNETGLICDMDENSLCQKIHELILNEDMREKLIYNLQSMNSSNENQIIRYESLMLKL